MKTYDLEDRLIDFAVSIIRLSYQISKNYAGNHLSKQIIRSGTSPGLHYGEAQSAESRKDFIHKMKWALKELRETHANLKILHRAKLCRNIRLLEKNMEECNELISIFVKSLQTASMKRE
jgi:four helix bundle protein